MDLASFHELKDAPCCIDCHTGIGIPGRFMGLMAGTSDLVSYVSGHYPQPAVMEEPIPDQNCPKCHANISQAQDMNNYFHDFLPKGQASDPKAATCVSCHNRHNQHGESKIGFLN